MYVLAYTYEQSYQTPYLILKLLQVYVLDRENKLTCYQTLSWVNFINSWWISIKSWVDNPVNKFEIKSNLFATFYPTMTVFYYTKKIEEIISFFNCFDVKNLIYDVVIDVA